MKSINEYCKFVGTKVVAEGPMNIQTREERPQSLSFPTIQLLCAILNPNQAGAIFSHKNLAQYSRKFYVSGEFEY